MSRTLLTHVEVVLLSWQQLPDELLTLSADWIVTESRFYRIAQADISEVAGGVNIQLIRFFEELKAANRICDFCSRLVAVTQDTYPQSPDTEQLMASELPAWVRQPL
jgi:hypothetical protein